ncbi:hypothetical protein JL721_9976 [Aureococcus anophagefferens]|nr:hypothetical protein JL721_9976 [Aureococcus anophagefferens]
MRPKQQSHVHLEESNVRDGDLAILAATNPTVNYLNLRGNPLLSHHGVEKLQHLDRCTHLDLSHCAGVEDKAMEHRGGTQSTSRVLNLSHTNVGDAGIHSFLAGIKLLEELYMRQCPKMTDKGLVEISRQIKLRQVIKVLDLRETLGFSNDALLLLMAEGGGGLHELNLRGCRQIDSLGLLGLRRDVGTLEMRRLDIGGLPHVISGSTLLGGFAGGCRRLRELRLTGLKDAVDDNALQAFAKAAEDSVHGHAPLEVLDLSLCPRSAPWACGPSYGPSRTLRDLDVSFCPLLDDAFCGALAPCLQLDRLRAVDTPLISDRGIATWVKGPKVEVDHYGARDERIVKRREGEPEPKRTRLALKELILEAALTGSVDTSARCRVPRYSERGIRSLCRTCGATIAKLDVDGAPRVDDAAIATVAKFCKNLARLGVDSCARVTDLGLVAVATSCVFLERLRALAAAATAPDHVEDGRGHRPELPQGDDAGPEPERDALPRAYRAAAVIETRHRYKARAATTSSSAPRGSTKAMACSALVIQRCIRDRKAVLRGGASQEKRTAAADRAYRRALLDDLAIDAAQLLKRRKKGLRPIFPSFRRLTLARHRNKHACKIQGALRAHLARNVVKAAKKRITWIMKAFERFGDPKTVDFIAARAKRAKELEAEAAQLLLDRAKALRVIQQAIRNRVRRWRAVKYWRDRKEHRYATQIQSRFRLRSARRATLARHRAFNRACFIICHVWGRRKARIQYREIQRKLKQRADEDALQHKVELLRRKNDRDPPHVRLYDLLKDGKSGQQREEESEQVENSVLNLQSRSIKPRGVVDIMITVGRQELASQNEKQDYNKSIKQPVFERIKKDLSTNKSRIYVVLHGQWPRAHAVRVRRAPPNHKNKAANESRIFGAYVAGTVIRGHEKLNVEIHGDAGIFAATHRDRVAHGSHLTFGEYVCAVATLSMFDMIGMLRWLFKSVTGRESCYLEKTDYDLLTKGLLANNPLPYQQVHVDTLFETFSSGKGEIYFEDWVKIAERLPILLFALLRFQAAIMKQNLGEGFWFKKKLEFDSVRDMLGVERAGMMNCRRYAGLEPREEPEVRGVLREGRELARVGGLERGDVGAPERAQGAVEGLGPGPARRRHAVDGAAVEDDDAVEDGPEPREGRAQRGSADGASASGAPHAPSAAPPSSARSMRV